MRLQEIRAASHPDGYRIDLTWANPAPAAFPGVRVVRREGTHPTSPSDGVVVVEGTGLAVETDAAGRARYRVSDTGLRGDVVYYYALFPYPGDPPDFRVDRANRAAALATSANGAPERMYELLPAIYRRYDGVPQQLRSFLELPGGQLDLLESYARAALDFRDLDRIDGRLLPLLAEWIGWRTDLRLEVDRQRAEIRGAPALYRRVGLIPVVGATVRRISGWESRSKEFVHNVARSNQPPRLYLRGTRLAADGGVAAPDAFLSLDFAYGGRPSAAVDERGIRWLFYHTLRRGTTRVWYKSSPTFRLPREARTAFEAADVARLQQHFAGVEVSLAADATVTAAGSLWEVDDASNGETYVAEPGAGGITVYRTSADPMELSPSRPLNTGRQGDEAHPAVVLQDGTLWVFWGAREAGGGWRIRYRTRRDGSWSEPAVFGGAGAAERRAPAAVVDQDGGLWLFWLERSGRRWFLRYNRFDPAGLAADPPDPAGWELDPPARFPLDGGDDPRVESEVSVLFHPGDPNRRIWVFWARREPTGDPGQTRWTVAYRVKAGIDPAVDDWGPVESLPRADPGVHDREPSARVDGDGNVALFWSSDRDGSWSVWRATLDLAAGPAWGPAAAVTGPPYAQRDPLAVPLDGETLLLSRSSESLEYRSDVYRASRTVDFRYAGSTTVHTRNAAQLALRGEFGDFLGYTFDTATGDGDWYRRDTLGVYLAPDTMDPERVARGVDRLRAVVPEFIPATDRAVFITRGELHTEHVYAYEAPAVPEAAFISESYADVLSLADTEPVTGPDTDFTDDLE